MQGALCVLLSCLVVLCASQGPQCNRPNETLECVRLCPPEKTCSNRGIFFNCLNENTKICQLRCVCKQGYIKNDHGECIPVNQCDNVAHQIRTASPEGRKCSSPYEFFNCGQECDNVCSELHIQNRTNCPIINIVCNPKCYCLDGYARDGKGICVPVQHCNNPALRPKRYAPQRPQDVCTGPNEIYTCKKTCPPELCFSLVARFKCDAEEVCKPRCYCKPGYLRVNDKSPCVPICQCPEMENSPDCVKKSD